MKYYDYHSMKRGLVRLEHQLRLIDRGLARRPGDAGLEARRQALEKEYAALYDADEFFRALSRLPRCHPCNKISHRTEALARRHAEALRLMNLWLEHGEQVRVYACPKRPGRWHVGHAAPPKDRHKHKEAPWLRL